MSKEFNAACSICGERYHVCNACKNVKTLKPWRSITDTIDCYKIYMIIHDYNNGAITKESARKMLDTCTLPKTFQPHIKTAIDEIMFPEKKRKTKKGVMENNLRNNEQ
ncbi:MAG: hypothetical protein ACOYBL_08870 [Lachnospiraceae bacterium]|jgi:hypothetical protein